MGRSYWSRRRPSLSAPAATGTTTARDLRGSPGDGDVLLTVHHECHRRSRLRQSRLQIEQLFAGIRAIRQEAIVDAGKNEIACGRQAATLVEAGSQSSPF